MSITLSLETSAAICSVALHANGELVKTVEVFEPQAHAAKVAVSIDQLLKAAGIEFSQLQAVAISSGPGSYTGLRIGTSVAKGLCFGLNIPLITIPTLALLANHVAQSHSKGVLCPMIDARRMEVYTQVFDISLNPLTEIEALIIDQNSFRELLDSQTMLFFGDGAGKCRSVLQHRNAEFVDGLVPKASMMGGMAHQKLMKKDLADLAHFTPFYLKEFVAKKAQSVFDQK